MCEVLGFPAKPKTRRSSRRSPTASANTKKCLCGILPADLQFDMELRTTPASLAAATTPPRASITSSTVVSMSSYNSGSLKKSRVQDSGIENSKSLIFHGVVYRFKEEVAFRLRLLPGVLGLAKGELADLMGISPSQWSNYTKPGASELIPPHNTAQLERVFGITASWVYHGNISTIGDVALRSRLAGAELNPPAAPKKRRPKRQKKNRRAA